MTEARNSDSEKGSSAGGEEDLRPVVAKKERNLSVAIFIAILAIVALLLFTALNARRQALTAPETRVIDTGFDTAGTTIPRLFIPQDFADAEQNIQTPIPAPPIASAVIRPVQQSEPQIIYRDQPAIQPLPTPQLPQRTAPSGPVLAFDRSSRQSPPSDTSPSGVGERRNSAIGGSTSRVQAGQLSNPSNTIVRGTVIPVVLETALDSTRSGQARAIVSRDVYGFDGQKILVPRGSRLIGEYDADLKSGQNRILVQWVRLLRPDGASIALDSGSADRLGRAGVRGRVDSKFLGRFADAILRTSLDVGAILLTREISDGGVVVALPNTVREAAPQSNEERFKPTLRVKQGAALSVFVARDLDFTPFENKR
jgi:type IV secretion system protein VirB10